MTVRLTLTYRATGAIVVKDFDNAVEARRELLRRAGDYNRKIQGNGSIGALVDHNGQTKVSYTVEEVTE